MKYAELLIIFDNSICWHLKFHSMKFVARDWCKLQIKLDFSNVTVKINKQCWKRNVPTLLFAFQKNFVFRLWCSVLNILRHVLITDWDIRTRKKTVHLCIGSIILTNYSMLCYDCCSTFSDYIFGLKSAHDSRRTNNKK